MQKSKIDAVWKEIVHSYVQINKGIYFFKNLRLKLIFEIQLPLNPRGYAIGIEKRLFVYWKPHEQVSSFRDFVGQLSTSQSVIPPCKVYYYYYYSYSYSYYYYYYYY